ncbi:MAG: hypothetical protein KAS97_08945, partial [Candidatus Aminicenantes bacterium]|nr:hypothetical protein [Candidatus Aminicenantes bacterium]
MKKIAVCICIVFLTISISTRSIKNSKHNLSSSGVGDIRTSDTNQICVFCHTSHTKRKNSPLWNREDSNVQYKTYNSSTLNSEVGQPDGASKLCLSCHDGTIALGKVLSISKELNLPNTSSGKFPKGHSGNLGINISNDHPISFNSENVTSQSSELNHPPSGDPVRYDGVKKIQCTTCHDPHTENFSSFLVKDNMKAALCKSCHDPTGFKDISTHDVSTKVWNGTGIRPWPSNFSISVNQNSCMNCHQSHNAAGSERLIRLGPDSEVCLACHNGNTGANIKSELRKSYSHSVDLITYKNTHDPDENILSSAIHVQCVDCHNPHIVNSTESTAPFVNGRSKGVSGINSSGIIVNNSQFEYEVCLKCHGQDRYNDPKVNRQDQNQNLNFAFDQSNKSYHPVVNQGASRNVPSLKIKWNESSRLYCTDCHNSNNARRNGGS